MAASIPGFDPNTFERYWTSLDSDARADLIARAGFFSPQLGILPIIKGLSAFRFNTREAARQSLTELVAGIRDKFKFAVDTAKYQEGQAEAVGVAGKLFHQVSSELPFAELGFLLTTLLALEDKGAFFAFKALYLKRVTPDTMKKVVLAVDEYQRLVFVDQYIQATPAIRLKFAPLFRQILGSIKHRQPVVRFYTSLFDRKRDPDPFLTNIDAALRDPDTILDNEVASKSPANKIMGLKALSMIQARIPCDLLLKALEGEEVKKVRIAVYSLIENSSMGSYPDLFDVIFSYFLKADPSEAVLAFKAMALTGRIPLYKLFELIRNSCPNVLPNIQIEISSLSRISFFVIQDIALNKDAYLKENLDINLACIFGMIKKRPERVIRILKAYEESADKDLKIDMTDFINKANSLLKKEKKSIESRFLSIVKNLERSEPEKTKGLLKAVLKDPVEKKLAQLAQGPPGQEIDFGGDSIKGRDLSNLNDRGASACFVETLFQDCELKGMNLSRAAFDRAVFYKVNMAGSVFERLSFNDAVFINVDARQARFHRCSFEGARFFNCNFNDADLSEALFIGAEFAKTTFARTDLTCASFVSASISGITFATADLTLTDFSGVRARFTRFPSYTHSLVRTENIDYNARTYQLGFKDLPQVDKSVVTEINMLVFCEFIHYGEQKFLNQNKLSLLTAFDIFKPTHADFFQLLPLLIHENFSLPDQRPAAASTPCGICDYLPSKETLALAARYLGKKKLAATPNLNPSIEGVFSMGSVGSLAQTEESDIDYWICVDERDMDREGLGLLRRKLDSIEALAWDKFKIRVTFFIMDVLKARNNDFGGSTQESSGSAQSRLLKEEFYRTMIHVAGKLPLWAVLPTTISLNYYNLILNRIERISQNQRYIDLGDIHAIPVNEYFGASIWQMFKWLKSPFKSVIKMALLEKYIQAYGQETLLCNQYKNEWMNSGTHLKPGQNDSYIILLNTLIKFYRELKDDRSAYLLLTCFFFKLGISTPSEADSGAFGMRRFLLDVCLAQWGWTFNKVFEIGRFKMWPYSAIQRLSITIERYMVSKYKDLKHRFDTQSVSGLMISEQDRIVLERKVNVIFQDKPHKIRQLILVSRGDRHFSRLHIKYLSVPGNPGKWGLVHKIMRQQSPVEEAIMTADTVEEIGAWLIHNHLYTNQTFLGLIPNATQVSHDNIKKLFGAMYGFFMPQMKAGVHFRVLREQPQIIRLFISVNFYDRKHQEQITDYAVVYLNSWGELYLRSSSPGTTIPNLAMMGELVLKGLSLKRFPRYTVFFTSGIMTTPDGSRYRP